MTLPEALRFGLSPSQAIAHWSAGDTAHLAAFLAQPQPGLSLLSGPSGSGKSHTLQWLRQQGLQAGYAIAWLSAWPGSGSLESPLACADQFWQNLEMPDPALGRRSPGPAGLFQHVHQFLKPQRAITQSEARQRDWSPLLNAETWADLPTLIAPQLYLMLRCWLQAEARLELLPAARYRLQAEIADMLQYQSLYQAADTDRYRLPQLSVLGPDFAYGSGPPVVPLTPLAELKAQLQQVNDWLKVSGLQGLLLIFDGHDQLLLNLEAQALQQAMHSWAALCAPDWPCLVLFSSQPDFAAQLTRRLVYYGLWECDSQLLDRPQLALLQPTAADWQRWLQQVSQAFDCPALASQAPPMPHKPADIRPFVQQVLHFCEET